MTRKFAIYVERHVTEEYVVVTDDHTRQRDVEDDYLAFIDGHVPDSTVTEQSVLLAVKIPDA